MSRHQTTALEILDGLTEALDLAVIDENWKHRVGRQTDLRIKFNAPDLTVRQEGYFQIINLEGHEITIGSNATDEQIGAEIARIRQTQEKPKMAVTGARFLADLIRTRQAQVKEQLAQAGNELNAVMDDMEATANEATKQVTEAKAEVADLKAALGLNSNGAPE